jgi:hypothetical protein
MSKRKIAGVLWFLAGWYAGSMLAQFIGASDVLGPILGVASAFLIARDPLHVIWPSRSHDAGKLIAEAA